MIGAQELGEIIATYERHGWILRRVLLTSETLERMTAIPAGVDIVDSEVDAAWFSRPPRAGEISWEIRSLGSPPFALVEFVDDESSNFENVLEAVKQRMIDSLTQRKRLDN